MGKFLKTFWGRVTAAVTFLAAVAAILSLLLALGVIRPSGYAVSTPTTACNAGLSDTFSSGSLDPKWTQVGLYPNSPSPLATYAITPGELRLTAPTGVDLDVAYNYNAPRIVQEANGNFTIETTVELNPSAEQFVPGQYDAYQGAGLLIAQDEGTYVRLDQGDRNNQRDVELIGYKEKQAASFVPIPTQDTPVTLAMQRQGDTITAWWMGSDGTKHQMGTFTVHFLRTEVGLALVNNSREVADVADSATFSGFSFACS